MRSLVRDAVCLIIVSIASRTVSAAGGAAIGSQGEALELDGVVRSAAPDTSSASKTIPERLPSFIRKELPRVGDEVDGDGPPDVPSEWPSGQVLAEIDASGETSSVLNVSVDEDAHTLSDIPQPSCVTGTYHLVGPLGNKVIPDNAIVASSYWHDSWKKAMWITRLDNRGTPWCPNRRGGNGDWVQWDFGADKLVTKVLTRGRHNAGNSWLSKYQVQYKQNGGKWKTYPNMLIGNSDKYTIVRRALSPPIRARWVRIVVQASVGFVCFRADFEGCSYVDPSAYRGAPGRIGPPGPPGGKGNPGAHGKEGVPGAQGQSRSAPAIDCVWALWTPFAKCSRTCGPGEKLRTRGFQVYPQGGGKTCHGSTLEMQSCNLSPCPVPTPAPALVEAKKAGAIRAGFGLAALTACFAAHVNL